MAKRTALVLVLAVVLVFAFATSAYAVVGDSGFAWLGTRGDNATTGTPHFGFSTTTYKCGVCHTVHNAAAAGEILLSSTVANSCTSCHLNNDATIKDVYGGAVANWETDTRANHSDEMGLTCTGCHGVHGANCVTAGATFDTFILKANAQMTLAGSEAGVSGGQGIPAGNLSSGTVDAAILSNFCTQCHGYYTTAYNEEHHVMIAATTDYGNTAATVPNNTTVAYATAEYCTSCHDYPYADPTDGFPHNVPGVDRFMQIAGYAGDTPVDAPLATLGAESDGACIKCHLDDTATVVDKGVGIGY